MAPAAGARARRAARGWLTWAHAGTAVAIRGPLPAFTGTGDRSASTPSSASAARDIRICCPRNASCAGCFVGGVARLRKEVQFCAPHPKRTRNQARHREGHRRAPQTAGRAAREISSTTPPTTTQTRAHARKASAGEPRTCATRDRCDVRGRCAVAAWLERGLRRRETPKQSGALHCAFELEGDKGLDSWRDLGIEVT